MAAPARPLRAGAYVSVNFTGTYLPVGPGGFQASAGQTAVGRVVSQNVGGTYDIACARFLHTLPEDTLAKAVCGSFPHLLRSAPAAQLVELPDEETQGERETKRRVDWGSTQSTARVFLSELPLMFHPFSSVGVTVDPFSGEMLDVSPAK